MYFAITASSVLIQTGDSNILRPRFLSFEASHKDKGKAYRSVPFSQNAFLSINLMKINTAFARLQLIETNWNFPTVY